VNACTVCATRGRATRLEDGHVCPACIQRLADQLDDIVRLASLATIEPRTGRGAGRSVPSSRPPLNIDGLDPALTPVLVATEWTSVVVVLEGWERLVRDVRRMAPYGVASASRAAGAYADTTATLTGVVGFLRASLPWWESDASQPVDDFASEVHACQRALLHYDPDREPAGTMIKCPTLLDEGECGYRLHYVEPDEQVTCRRCGVTRDAMTLVTVALSDGDTHVWVDPEAAEKETGVSVTTLKRWANRGIVHYSHGRYDLREVHRAVEKERTAAHLNLLRRVSGTA